MEVAMKKWIALGVCLFPIALGVVAGLRLSKESLAVIIGVLFGLVASLPLYLVTFLVLKREVRSEEPKVNAYPPTPPVIVVNPGGATRFPTLLPPYEGGFGYEPRTFRVIGEEGED